MTGIYFIIAFIVALFTFYFGEKVGILRGFESRNDKIFISGSTGFFWILVLAVALIAVFTKKPKETTYRYGNRRWR